MPRSGCVGPAPRALSSSPKWDDIIRPATPGDADTIADVHVRAWQAAYQGVVPQQHLDQLGVGRRARWWRQILEEPPFVGQRTWVALRVSAIIGFAGHTRDDDDDRARVGELQAIYVAPEAWRLGIGSPLMEVVVEYAAASGFREATVWVLTDNLIGRAFYESHGWGPDGTSKVEVWDGVAMNEVRYRLDLGSG